MDQTESSERKAKTTKSRRETAVQGTNDNSIVSKCSMSGAGYFHDPFLKEFVAKNSKRAPLINRGYYVRATCIDQVLRQFLAKNQGSKKQIVSLGAGFDSAYFRLKSDKLLEDTAFFEIDFPEVTKRKHAIIESKSKLSDLLNLDEQKKKVVPPIELWTSDYCLLGVDLTQLNTLEAALRMCGADFDTPTLFLSECVMTYMTRRCSSALVKWAGETFLDAIFVMFEQINPDDAFGIFMQNHFHTIGSPLKCITAFPTMESQIKRFLDLGWQKCKCHDLNEMYRHALTAEERARIETLDPFDEYEEFNLKCAHYFVLLASTSSSITDYLFTSTSEDCSSAEAHPESGLITLTHTPLGKPGIKRFSHSSVLVADRYIMTSGGFGEVDGRHQRVQEISLTDTATMETQLIRCHSDEIQYSRMHHSAIMLSDGRMMLCGGRQSPFFLCTQLLVFDLHIHADSSSVCEGQGHRQSAALQEGTGDRTGGSNSAMQTNSNSGDHEKTNGVRNDEDDKVRNGTCTSSDVNSTVAEGASICDTTHSNPSVSENSTSSSSNNRPNRFNRTGSRDRQVLVTKAEELTNFEGGHVTCSVLKQSGDIPCPRWRHASALVNMKGSDCVFLHGGRTQKAEVLSDTYMLDVFAGVWTKVECSGDLPGALHSHCMLTWGEREAQRVVMVGGMDGDQCPQSSIFLLNPHCLTWQRLQVKGHFFPRYSHTCHIVGDKLVAVGGVNLHRQTPGVAILNLSTGQAQEFSFPSVSRNQMLMFHRHCSVILPDNRIVVLGGGGNCFSFGTHLNCTPVTVDIYKCLEAVP
ncbi:tRNA wybutosine-synthesizing protein 4-like [Littorina saxatilis]|uniref:tRNA wybutosine-synthesizing protein 4 n=1 Tax=Littorina saxatilis TaxID=31220 RepID=A0AAN9GJB2_9CAEN